MPFGKKFRESDLAVHVGSRFGRLVINDMRRDYSNPDSKRQTLYAYCECDCGNVRRVNWYALKSGQTVSCGCRMREAAAENRAASAVLSERNGTRINGKATRLYRIYRGIKTRLYNPNVQEYPRYGGRGLDMCGEWRNDFQSFRKWALRNGYSDLLTIERVDNKKGYYPSNCIWATPKEQGKNTKKTVYVEYNGKREKLLDLTERFGLSHNLVWERIHKLGMSVEEAIARPPRIKNLPVYQYSLGGIYLKKHASIKEAASITGVNPSNIRACVSGANKSAGGYRWARELIGGERHTDT